MLDTKDPGEIERFGAQGSCILITVAKAKGSTPRIAGTKMLASLDGVLGTIGGGQLEYMAMDAARDMLRANQAERTLSIPLGPEIGQCCGGHLTLLLSKVLPSQRAALASSVTSQMHQQPSVYIFGAGHVGRALATAMLPLPVNSLLIDSRREELALADPAIDQDLTALPETHIRHAKPGSAFVMLTHDHALDFILTREALEQQDAAYIGMIGSKSKRATFASWLEDEMGNRDALARLTMPIGASTLKDKRPAVIAAMAASEIMQAVGTYAHARVPA
ncbi:MAG: xanthine dehydrogenase accessory protein XdhC [Devosiaceae bacterium]